MPMAGAGEAALIARGAGKWGNPDFPKDGWVCVDTTDRGEPDVTCEMCEYKAIRYVQHLRHPTGIELDAGCVCAGHLTGDLDQAKSRDVKMRNASTRLRNRQKALGSIASDLSEIKPYPRSLNAINGLRRRAETILKRAEKDVQRYDCTALFDQEMEAHFLIEQATTLANSAEQRSPAYRLAQTLSDPHWWDTPKGQRFETGQGDVVQVYRDRLGMIGYGYEVAHGGMKFSRSRCSTWQQAKRAGIRALTKELRRAGRLPR